MIWVAAAQAAMSIAGSLFGSAKKKKEARRQAVANHNAALHMFGQYIQSAQELGEQQLAANEETTKDDEQFSLEAAREIATAKVQSDSTGIGGNTQFHLLTDIARENAKHAYNNSRSLHYTTLQIQNQYTAAAMRYQGQLSSTPATQKPSNGYLEAGLNGAATFANSYFGSK
ncbi:TPA: virion core protein, T7 gp14 family [Photobacterium damselae]